MKRQFKFILPTLIIAFVILGFSVYTASAIEYDFTLPTAKPVAVFQENSLEPVLQPDNLLWFFKAASDRLKVMSASDPLKKSYELLYIGNDRLLLAKYLFEHDKANLGMSVLSKAEKYLDEAWLSQEKASELGINTGVLRIELEEAAHSHKQVIDNILFICPEDACPFVVLAGNTSKQILQTLSEIPQAI